MLRLAVKMCGFLQVKGPLAPGQGNAPNTALVGMAGEDAEIIF